MKINVSCSHDSSINHPVKKQRLLPHQGTNRPWKEVYKERFKVGLNWKHGRYKTTVLKGHSDSVMCLQIHNNFLVTGSYDASIRLWNLNSGHFLAILLKFELYNLMAIRLLVAA